MDDLPNGFTGFAHRPEGFISAGEASRMSRGVSANASRGGAGQHARERAVRTTKAAATPPGKAIPFSDVELDAISQLDQRWAWAQIDLSAIRHNVAETRRFLAPRCRLMAVVKADAYGHGAVEVSKAALGAGADRLAVATVPEAVELRKAGILAPLLLLSQPPAASIPLLLAHNITPAIYEPDFAVAYGEAADRHGMMAPYHLAVNTGMNRIGVRHDDAVEFLYQTNFHRALQLEGVFTHFATADCAETLDFQLQAKRFIEAVQNMQAAGFDPGIVHAANSAALTLKSGYSITTRASLPSITNDVSAMTSLLL